MRVSIETHMLPSSAVLVAAITLPRYRTAYGVLGICLLLFAAFALYAAFEARHLHVVSDTLSSPSLPEQFDGTRVVFIADIHAGRLFGPDRMRDLVETVDSLEPDVLVLGGDYVGGRSHGAEVFYPAATGFSAKLGKVAVLGNHDSWEGESAARAGLAKAGFTLLDNNSVQLSSHGATIAVAGLEDYYTGRPSVQRAARGIDASGFAILVSHNPDAFASALPDEPGVFDLALAGHTHGGQLVLGGFAPLVPSQFGQRYRTGWRSESGVPILVTNGIGTVTAPVRFFARPEINLITLRRGPASSPADRASASTKAPATP